MRPLRLALFAALTVFAVLLRARPYKEEGASASAVSAVRASLESAGGTRAVSAAAFFLWAVAFGFAFDGARVGAGFAPAGFLSLLMLPMGAGDSALSPWLFSAFYAAALLWIFSRARYGGWPGPMFLAAAPLSWLWAVCHPEGALLAPLLTAAFAVEYVRLRRAAAPPAAEAVPDLPADLTLFRPEEIDLSKLVRVLSWETKVNQLVHARLGLTPAQLPSLTMSRALTAINSLLDISDLPAQVEVPDPGPAGDMRRRNRRVLDILFKDVLKRPTLPGEGVAHPPLVPEPLWALLATVLAVVGLAGVYLAGGDWPRFGWKSIDVNSLWVLGPRVGAALPYFWITVGLVLIGSLWGAKRNAEHFSSILLLTALSAGVIAAFQSAAAPLFMTLALPAAAFPWRDLWKEETPVRGLLSTALLLLVFVSLFLIDWEHLPLAGTLSWGAAILPPK